jgi:hypothetical protein
MLARLGIAEPAATTSSGFAYSETDMAALGAMKHSTRSNDESAQRKLGPWSGIQFWYRQSPKHMWSSDFLSFGRITTESPAWTVPGMAGVWLSPQGELRQFRAVPPSSLEEDAVRPSPVDAWREWFPKEVVGFELGELETATWQITPPDACDQIWSWEGTWPNSEERLYVAAAAYRGKPVFFRVLPPDGFAEVMNSGASGQATTAQAILDLESASPLSSFLFTFTFVCIFLAVPGGALLLAWWNIRLGRGDRRGAFRVAVSVFGLLTALWLLTADHVSGLKEIVVLRIGAAHAIFLAATSWLLYMALEPFVRRVNPETLIASTRVLDGRWSDSRVGRDLLVAVLVGVIEKIMWDGSVFLSSALAGPKSALASQSFTLDFIVGTTGQVAVVLQALLFGILFGLWLLMLLLLLRLVIRRRRWPTVVAVLLFSIAFTPLHPGEWYIAWPMNFFNSAIMVWLLTRLGIFATATAFSTIVLLSFPITADSSVFYFSNGLFRMILVLGIAGYGAWTSIDRRFLGVSDPV